jgi:uncharacterized protein YjbI with pentapeptide repeats
LSDADLEGADLFGANLSDANLIAADLTNVRLTSATGSSAEQLSKCKSLKGATMPNGQKYEDWLKDNGSQKAD